MTSFPEIPNLTTRDEFDAALLAARRGVAELLRGDPTDPLYVTLDHQLEALHQWTRDDLWPSHAERDRLTLGLLAQRELKPDAPTLAALLIALHNYVATTAPLAAPR